MRCHIQKSGNLFVRLTHRVRCGNICSYVAISFMWSLLFRDESGIAICIRKTSVMLCTGQRRDWLGDMEINGRRIHSIFPIYGESLLDYSRSCHLARYVFKATLQCIERCEISIHLKNTFPFYRFSAFILSIVNR